MHVLGYWVDGARPGFAAFLDAQRARRVARVEAIGAALAAEGAPIDLGPLLAERPAARPGASVGRPDLARRWWPPATPSSVQDAFDRLLGDGCPAYVARTGVAPAEVFAIIHEAGGVASLAHPGVTRRDDRLASWAADGLDALEAYHSDHSEAEVTLYLERARTRSALLVTGGSDFHGDDPMSHRVAAVASSAASRCRRRRGPPCPPGGRGPARPA